MSFLDRTIIEGMLPPRLGDEIAHYTGIGMLCYFIPEGVQGWGSAWATPVQFLNDRMELSLGLQVLRDAAKVMSASRRILGIINDLFTTFGRLETYAFQMSFSGAPDELGQWRGYGANGMGCAIVTKVAAVYDVADIAGWVIYDEQSQKEFAQKIIGNLHGMSDVDLIERILVASASYMKHDGFAAEQEYRLLKFPDTGDIKFRQTNERIVPYIDYLAGSPSPLPINRIIIGPGWRLSQLKGGDLARNHVVQGIDRLLSARGLEKITSIESSRIPYDPK